MRCFSQRGFAPLVILVFLALIGAGSGTAVVASQKALPGQPLYKVKIISENIQLGLVPKKEEKARLYLKFAEKRLEEVEKLQENNASVDLITGTLNTYKEYYDKAIGALGKVESQTEEVKSVAQDLKDQADKRKKIIDKVLEKLPEDKKEEVKGIAEDANKSSQDTVSRIENAPTVTPTPTQVSANQSIAVPTPVPVLATSTPILTPTMQPTASDVGIDLTGAGSVRVPVSRGSGACTPFFFFKSTGLTHYEISHPSSPVYLVPTSGTVSSGGNVTIVACASSNSTEQDVDLEATIKNSDNGKSIKKSYPFTASIKGTITAEVYIHRGYSDYPADGARIKAKTLSGQLVGECTANSAGRCDFKVDEGTYDVYTLAPIGSNVCGEKISSLFVPAINSRGGGGRLYEPDQVTNCIRE